MPKSGIKIISEEIGAGPELRKGDRVRIICDIQLNGGDPVAKNQESIWYWGSRDVIAGFRYGLEGMRLGGTRKFKASPHLCYRDQEVAGIPANSVLVFDIKKVELL